MRVRRIVAEGADFISSPFRLPSEAGNSGLLKETGVAPAKGKTIRIARAPLATAGSEGSDRK